MTGGSNGMTPMENLERRKRCEAAPSKKRYSLIAEAAAAAQASSLKAKLPIIAYACPSCGGFHLSKKTNGSDVVSPNSPTVVTAAMRSGLPKTQYDFPVRRDMSNFEVFLPGNKDARVKSVKAYVESSDRPVSTRTIAEELGIRESTVRNYMRELGYTARQGKGAVWTKVDGGQSTNRYDEPLDETPVAPVRELRVVDAPKGGWTTLTEFPTGIGIQDWLRTLSLAQLDVEIRVRPRW